MIMKNRLLFFLLLIATFTGYAQTPCTVGPRANTANDPANSIYVSPTGNDATATGTIDKPYKSINSALAKAGAGGTVVLRGGYYDEKMSVRVQNPNVTIKSAKGEWAVIDLPLASDPDTWKQSSTIRFNPEASGSKLQAVEVTGGFYAVCMETKWDWGQPDRSGVSNVIIEDCKLHDSRNDVVKVKPNCDDITIRYCEIYNSGREHINHTDFPTGQRNSEGIDNVNGDRMHVHHNYIHDICSNAIYAKGGATDAIIEYNIVEHTYGGGIQLGFDTSPEYFDTIVNPQYYENLRGTVRNNLIMNVGWEGIGLYASKDAQVYNNTIVNAVGYGTGNFHTPISFGIATQDWDNHAGCPPSVNPNIHHNIVSQPSTSKKQMIEVRYRKDFYNPPAPPYHLSALVGMPAMNNNCYYIDGETSRFDDFRPGSLLNNATLSEWKTHIGGDAGSLEINPALGANYMPANPQCAGMGIPCPLIVGTTVGIETISDFELQVYPNPTSGEFKVQSLKFKVQSVEIFDVYGRLQRTESRKQNTALPSVSTDGTEWSFDISDFPAGIYFLRIQSEKGIITKKVIKN
jgi:hypothetical protein